jgi:hypothetical protein
VEYVMDPTPLALYKINDGRHPYRKALSGFKLQ